ncbi:Hypp5312 [Branchiostoma lanceolatum]|uniref:Hypp5312 protein n=1 Tax=Branchiostoma lanceolatum TaxID=7740 RepID=A0A8K0AGN5_BRALA|nr:Hypp5312 [Branchiostoma lanceolatum]
MMISADRSVLKLALFCALLGVLIPNATSTGCSSKFPTGGVISSCRHADGRPYNVKELKSQKYAEGTRCLFKCTGGAPVERECQDGRWSGYEIECLTGVSHRRGEAQLQCLGYGCDDSSLLLKVFDKLPARF